MELGAENCHTIPLSTTIEFSPVVMWGQALITGENSSVLRGLNKTGASVHRGGAIHFGLVIDGPT